MEREQTTMLQDEEENFAPGTGLLTLGWVLLAFAGTLAILWWILTLSPMGLTGKYDALIGVHQMKRDMNVVFSFFVTTFLVPGVVLVVAGYVKNRTAAGTVRQGPAAPAPGERQ